MVVFDIEFPLSVIRWRIKISIKQKNLHVDQAKIRFAKNRVTFLNTVLLELICTRV